eukprot:SAG31_NODE_31439_length_368_cov_0.773234_1_plen_42_part_01
MYQVIENTKFKFTGSYGTAYLARYHAHAFHGTAVPQMDTEKI